MLMDSSLTLMVCKLQHCKWRQGTGCSHACVHFAPNPYAAAHISMLIKRS